MPFYSYVKIGLSIVHSLSVTIALLKSSWYKSVNVYSKFKNYFTKGSILSILNTHRLLISKLTTRLFIPLDFIPNKLSI